MARGGSTQGGSTQTGGTDDASIAGEAGAPSEAAAGGINALGGAPSGGGTTPSAGALNVPEVEFPAGCAELSRSGDAVSCNYEFACDSQTRFTGCQKERDGTWVCQCGSFSDETRYFEIRGVEDDVCNLAARVCVNDIASDDTPACRRREGAVDARSCTARVACGPMLALGDGVEVRAVENFSVMCSSNDTAAGGFTCSCQGGALHGLSYPVRAPDVAAACDFVVAFCSEEEPPDASGPDVCTGAGTPSSDGPGQCGWSQRCERSHDLADGVSIVGVGSRSVQCTQQADGATYCKCFIEDPAAPARYMGFEFDVSLEAGGATICPDAIGFCSARARLEPTGTIACAAPEVIGAGPVSCQAMVSCKRPVTSDGSPIVGYGALGIRCERASPTAQWSCSCASAKESFAFEVGDAADGTEACTDAAGHCQGAIDAVIGPHTGTPTPPAPSASTRRH